MNVYTFLQNEREQKKKYAEKRRKKNTYAATATTKIIETLDYDQLNAYEIIESDLCVIYNMNHVLIYDFNLLRLCEFII